MYIVVMELIYIRGKKSQNPDFTIIKGPDFIIITRGHFMHLRRNLNVQKYNQKCEHNMQNYAKYSKYSL